jgi:hypothetical protein
MRIVQLMTDRSRYFNPSKNYWFSFNAFLISLIGLYFRPLHWGSYGSIWTGPSPKNIIWTEASEVHLYNIFLVTDRSIYCHMTRSDMNYFISDKFPNFSKLDTKSQFIWLMSSEDKILIQKVSSLLHSLNEDIFLVTDRSIYCHMTRSDMNYLLYYAFYLK